MGSVEPPVKVLLIEDNPGDVDLVRENLGADPRVRFLVTAESSLGAGLARLRNESFDVVLLDLDLPDSERSSTFDRVHEAVPQVPVVVHSGSVDDVMATRAVQRGAQDSLVKGRVGPDTLSRVLRFAIERKRLEEALHRLEEVTRRAETEAAASTVLKGAPIPMIMVDRQLRVRMANEAAARFAGLDPSEAAAGRLLSDFLGSDLAPDCCPVTALADQAASEGGVHSGVEMRVEFREGRGRPWADVLASAACVPLADDPLVVVCLEDVTRRLKVEESLRVSRERIRQAQELEAIGRLAGGVAHDFNNLLAVILGYAELMQERLPSEDPLREGVDAIVEAGRRGASLTRQLLAFGRKQILEPQVIDLAATVAETGKMLRRLIGENITLEMDLGPEPAKVVADLGQVEQVVMNLAINARDAMPEGGRLVLRARQEDVGEAEAGATPEARTGTFVCLDVEDSGCGMDPETLRHAFEPFFSTKATGTGLGLSVVHGIVQQHRGWIQIASEPGHGTHFRIFLPSAPEGAALGQATGVEQQPPAPGSGDVVLVVEDEPALGRLASLVLERNGYRVRSASCVEEALETFRNAAGEIRLVFSDVVLPDGSGIRLAELLREQRPDLAVVMTSGYADRQAQADLIRKLGLAFVQKPYSPGDVLRAVHKALAGTRAQPGRD